MPLLDRVGERLSDISPGWTTTAFGEKVFAALSGEGPARFDYVNPDTRRLLDVQVHPSDDGVSFYIEDVTDRRRHEFEQRFLTDASAVLADSLDLDLTLQNLAALCTEHLADFCVVDSISEPGRVPQTVVAHRDAAQQDRLVAFREQFPFDPDAEFGPGPVLRTGRARLHEVIDDETNARLRADHNGLDAFLELGFCSVIIVPMVSRAIVQGVISLVSHTPGCFTPADLPLAEELGRRAGAAIDNARLYRNAQAAIAAREEFLSVAAHELRTPMTAIGGFAGLLQREVNGGGDSERIRRYVRRLDDASTRLRALVEDMLDVSRIQSGRMLLRPSEFDLAVLTRELVDRTADAQLNNRIRIIYGGPESDCLLRADDDRIEQAISILIDNAIKFSPRDEAIAVRLAEAPGGWEISVEDHGIGLPGGADRTIFEPFERALNARQANITGLGIGLSIARGIVERHGGAIWATSRGEGEGATIGFRLPAQPLDC